MPHETYASVFRLQTTLNAFAAHPAAVRRVVRSRIQELLSPGSVLEKDVELCARAIIPLEEARNHVPFHIGDYTDFYGKPNDLFVVSYRPDLRDSYS
jgi:fumarylacetoacetase